MHFKDWVSGKVLFLCPIIPRFGPGRARAARVDMWVDTATRVRGRGCVLGGQTLLARVTHDPVL